EIKTEQTPTSFPLTVNDRYHKWNSTDNYDEMYTQVLQKAADKTSSKEALLNKAQEVEIALTSWALTCILFRSSSSEKL
ncbi:Hypothetical predicted protein, partial [Mytilus galloprovincialis]